MAALLLVLCLLLIVTLVALVLGLVGVAMSVVTAIALVNASVVTLGALYGRHRPPPETWAEVPHPAAEIEREHIITDRDARAVEEATHRN
jgi:hypothetical protein